MEFKEILRKISFPLKQRKNEDDDIREEENHISEVQTNVNFLFFIYYYFQFSEKSTLFIALGFERKEEEEVEEMEYGEYSMDEYINQSAP